MTVLQYRLHKEAVKEAFGGKNTIPFSLWELRWCAYHQVIQVGVTQPRLPQSQKTCPQCRTKTSTPPEDTVEHHVSGCPSAREVWQMVARHLGWPALGKAGIGNN